jgi:CheY-like chemotaxis protein
VTILVADDNEMLRKLAATLLRHNGYKVLLAADGQEAVEMFQKESEAIALVLLDLMMPRLSGLEALHEMRKIDPDVRIVLASGFADLERSEVERARVQGFIAKPYRERDLISAVRSALAAPGAVDNGLCTVP